VDGERRGGVVRLAWQRGCWEAGMASWALQGREAAREWGRGCKACRERVRGVPVAGAARHAADARPRAARGAVPAAVGGGGAAAAGAAEGLLLSVAASSGAEQCCGTHPGPDEHPKGSPHGCVRVAGCCRRGERPATAAGRAAATARASGGAGGWVCLIGTTSQTGGSNDPIVSLGVGGSGALCGGWLRQGCGHMCRAVAALASCQCPWLP
jgi:hypothetical protein